MAREQKITLSPTVWDDVAADHIKRAVAVSRDRLAPLGWYRREWNDGRLSLVAVLDEGERVATIALRRDADHAGAELVVVAAGGNDPAADLTREVLTLLEPVALKEGCASIRLHTPRRGLIAKAEKLGWYAAETVMRKQLEAAHVE